MAKNVAGCGSKNLFTHWEFYKKENVFQLLLKSRLLKRYISYKKKDYIRKAIFL